MPQSQRAAGSRLGRLPLRAGISLAAGHASPPARGHRLKACVMRGNGVARTAQVCVLTCVTEEVGCGVTSLTPSQGFHSLLMRRSSHTFAALRAFQQPVREREHVTARRVRARVAIKTYRQPVAANAKESHGASRPAGARLDLLAMNETRERVVLMDERAGRRTAGEALAPAAPCLSCRVTVAGVRNLISLPILLNFFQQSFLEIEIGKFAVFLWRVTTAQKANFDTSPLPHASVLLANLISSSDCKIFTGQQ